jgi:P27 family predicted phage terminase small subunit
MAETIPIRARAAAVAGDSAPPEPPDHLSAEAADMWREIAAEWVLDAGALPLLRGALESWDTYQACRKQVATEGPTFTTDTGMVRAHPAAKLALDNFAAFRQALRQLGLKPAEED